MIRLDPALDNSTNFADNQFTVFDEADTTKILAFDVGTLITTGNTRILKIPDSSGTIPLLEISNQFEADQIIDTTSTEAFLVRRNGDSGDVFRINTTNTQTELQEITSLAQDGNITIQPQAKATNNNSLGMITLQAGQALAGAIDGGYLNVYGGTGGDQSETGGSGGIIEIKGGDGGDTDSNTLAVTNEGGNVLIHGGDGGDNPGTGFVGGDGGNVRLYGGNIGIGDIAGATLGIVIIGDTATTSHSLDNKNDLLIGGELEIDGQLFADGISTFTGLSTFNGGIHLNDNQNIELGSNTGGDITIDFDGTDASMDRVTGTPNFNLNLPIFVTTNEEGYSRFGPAPTTPPAISNNNDTLVCVKSRSAASGLIRGGLIIAEYTGTGTKIGFGFGLNSFFYHQGTGNMTQLNPGPCGGRYALRVNSTGNVTTGGGIASSCELLSNATITSGYAFLAEGNDANNASATFTTSYNYWGKTFGLKTGTLANNIGFFQESLSDGTTSNVEFGTSNDGMYACRVSIGTQPTEYMESTDADHLDFYATTSIDLNADMDISTKNIITDTTTGTKIATATNQKLGFFNATPIIQQTTTSQTAATFVANTSGIADDTATWNGYTIGDIVAILQAFGFIA